MKKLVGITMLATFFVAVFTALAIQIGPFIALAAFGLTIICTGWVMGAVILISR